MKKYQNKEWLFEHYVNMKLSEREIAKICECGKTTIHEWIEKYDIPRRNISESTKLAMEKFKGDNNPMWKGGKTKKHGYVYIYVPKHPFSDINGYVAQHRLVCEASLRRYFPNHPALTEIDSVKYLRKGWIPHHPDGIRDNNVWSNLSVMPNPSHSRFHTKKRHENSDFLRNKMSLSQQLYSSTSENNNLISTWGF